jgi:hypothetical protein
MKIMQELEVQVPRNVNFRQLRDSYAYYSPEKNPSPRQESNTVPIYEYTSTRWLEVFRPEDSGGRIVRKLAPVHQTARRHVPKDHNLDCL